MAISRMLPTFATQMCALLLCGVVVASNVGAQELHDNFDGNTLDLAKWQRSGGGTASVAGGLLTLSADTGEFPYITTSANPFPASGDFRVRIGFRYPFGRGGGNGFGATNGFVLGGSGLGFWIWQDGGGLRVSCGEGLLQLSVPEDTTYHVYEWRYLDGTYYFYLDGVLRASDASAFRPTGMFIGSPPINAVGYSIQQADFVDVQTLPVPIITDVAGRGIVTRSPDLPQLALDTLLSLTAVPLPGARFAGWSGDTTAVQSTLVITVRDPRRFVATFVKDLTTPPPVLADVSDVPGDEGARVRVRWQPSPLDTGAAPRALCCYLIERRAVSVPSASWTQIASLPAASLGSYAHEVSTPSDSTLADPATFDYRVIAQANGDNTQWPSNTASGYSVDNLAPPAPASVTGTIAAGVAAFFWPAVSTPDFAGYRVFRGLEASPPTDATHLVATTTATSFSDSPGFYVNYRVTAFDVHGNDSPGTLFVPLNPADVHPGPAPTTLSVGNPSPLPMGRRMTMAIGLPHAMSATVDVLDSQGRLVRRLLEGERSAGWVTVSWDARDSRGKESAAGVYFVRVQTPEGRSVKRVVLIP